MSAFEPDEAEWEARRKKRAPWGVIALVMLTGLALLRNGSGEFDEGPPQPAGAAAADTRVPGGGVTADAVRPLPYAVPDRVTIPAIQVDAPVIPVGLDADGWVAAPPPQDPNLAGWFTGAVSPGEKGTSVVVGHVDNAQGPAVFYGLGALKKGNRVEILRKDGRTAVFEVYGIEVFAKNDFPGDRVYASKGTAELRVITCGGGFSQQNGYDGNVVAFARLAEVR
ncbi:MULTISPECIES: class F sortase [Streptomyces]|uniref:Class F sortase n=1 Tax=Streptomyces edwardsiae TaxID=3075527 RepID=A0ABU2QLJ6_9ACTN|nr:MULTISPECIES: class F sortase [unclassified Streptomyces]MDT0405341.1 class F sortase [Streptomyces sp. DSM 41635]